MLHEFGLWSLAPPVIAIVLAIWTKQVYISLIVGIFLGLLIVADGNFLEAFMATVDACVQVFSDAGNTRTIMFSAIIGALILFIQRSGGVDGFIQWMTGYLKKDTALTLRRQKIRVQFLAFLTGLVIFVESSMSSLTVGTVFRPLFDRLKISREKLAYIADSSSAPICILIPLNGWGALIMGLLIVEGFSNPFQVMMQSIIYNLYPLIALVLLIVVIATQWDLTPMNKAEIRTQEGGLLWPDAQPMVSEEITEVKIKEGVTPKTANMLVPLLTMVLMMVLMLVYSGWNSTEVSEASGSLSKVIAAIGQGSGSLSGLIAVIVAVLVASVFYATQRIFTLSETVDLIFKGIAGLMPIALLLMLAFAIGAVCKQLGTGPYVASIAADWVNPGLIPALIFMISCFIAFSTGTSWGTFAIMIPIAIPMAEQMAIPDALAIGAALGGGIFGDHCSPISDTTILSSMAAATDHIDHVRTQIPYAILAGVMAVIGYLLIGFLS